MKELKQLVEKLNKRFKFVQRGHYTYYTIENNRVVKVWCIDGIEDKRVINP